MLRDLFNNVWFIGFATSFIIALLFFLLRLLKKRKREREYLYNQGNGSDVEIKEDFKMGACNSNDITASKRYKLRTGKR